MVLNSAGSKAAEARGPERKLVAILAADVEGYCRMMHRDEEATLATLTSRRSVIDGLIEAAFGSITSTAGDSVLAHFASVVEAVSCAVAIQTVIAAANVGLPTEGQMVFRIGVHVDDIMVKDGRIYGDGVNVAARVEALAPPGGICVTRGVRDHVRDRANYEFEDQGDHSVKNIVRPIHIFRVIFDAGEIAAVSDVPCEFTASPACSSAIPEEPDVALTFWKSAQAGNALPEYQAYLDRYPDGAFAGLAAARLAAPPTLISPPIDDMSVELAFWQSVTGSADAAMYKAYLVKYPQGQFSSLAEIRRRALSSIAPLPFANRRPIGVLAA